MSLWMVELDLNIDDRCFEGEETICTNENCNAFGETVFYHPGIQYCVCAQCSRNYLSKEAIARVRAQLHEWIRNNRFGGRGRRR